VNPLASPNHTRPTRQAFRSPSQWIGDRDSSHYAHEDDAHYKPSLVEVVDIVINNAILGLGILYEGKLLANDLWILVFGPLVVVSTRITRLELWLAFDEVVCPELADRVRVTVCQQDSGTVAHI
jgi:hypothetical protein